MVIPDMEINATKQLLEQEEVLCGEWAVM